MAFAAARLGNGAASSAGMMKANGVNGLMASRDLKSAVPTRTGASKGRRVNDEAEAFAERLKASGVIRPRKIARNKPKPRPRH
jgi:hypothetical protein